MGERGPAPVPTPILKARGSWRGAAREKAGEVQFPAGKPTCPSFLSREAKAEWKRQVGVLEEVGVLSAVDRAALAQWCEAWSEWRDLVEEIARRQAEYAQALIAYEQYEQGVDDPNHPAAGETPPVLPAPFLGSDGWVTLARARDRAGAKVLRWAGQFGFSPSARTRLREAGTGPAEREEAASGKARFFAS